MGLYIILTKNDLFHSSQKLCSYIYSGSKMKFQIIIATFLIVFNMWVSGRPLDKVDDCLFTCDYCFKDDLLLKCANQCLVTADMSLPWTLLCPYFGVMEFETK